jgi:hypothetical protein
MPRTRRFLADFGVLLSVFPWPAADQNVGMAGFVNKTPFTVKNDTKTPFLPSRMTFKNKITKKMQINV